MPPPMGVGTIGVQIGGAALRVGEGVGPNVGTIVGIGGATSHGLKIGPDGLLIFTVGHGVGVIGLIGLIGFGIGLGLNVGRTPGWFPGGTVQSVTTEPFTGLISKTASYSGPSVTRAGK